jgi:hypothetical protein
MMQMIYEEFDAIDRLGKERDVIPWGSVRATFEREDLKGLYNNVIEWKRMTNPNISIRVT